MSTMHRIPLTCQEVVGRNVHSFLNPGVSWRLRRTAPAAFVTAAATSDHHPDAREGMAAFREKRPARVNAWLVGG